MVNTRLGLLPEVTYEISSLLVDIAKSSHNAANIGLFGSAAKLFVKPLAVILLGLARSPNVIHPFVFTLIRS